METGWAQEKVPLINNENKELEYWGRRGEWRKKQVSNLGDK